MLINNEKLYEALERHIKAIFHEDTYVHIHAVYEPDDDGGPHEGYYHAAVDVYEPGMTYHVYFLVADDDNLLVDIADRWFMG